MSLNGASVQLMPTEPATVDPGGEFGIRHFKTRIESWSNVVAYYLIETSTRPDGTTYTHLGDQVVYWDVWSKSGEHYFFGPLPAMDGNPADQASDYSLTFDNLPYIGNRPWRNEWMLRKVVDVDSNTMEYTYSGDTSTRCLLLDEIRYGANDALSYPHFAAVRCLYESREYTRVSYRNGRFQEATKRLRAVCAGTWNGPGSLTEANALRLYRLTYSTSRTSGRSLLNQVEIVGRGGSSEISKTVRFDYSTYDSAPMEWEAGTGAYSASSVFQGELFSTGYYKYGNGQSEWGGAASSGTAMVDVNGDGLPDKVDYYTYEDAGIPNGSANRTAKAIYLNPGPDGTAWTPVDSPSIPGRPMGYFRQNGVLEHNGVDLGVRFADVNSDGIADKIDCAGGVWMAGRGVFFGRKDGKGWETHGASKFRHIPNQVQTTQNLVTMLPPDDPPGGGGGRPYVTLDWCFSRPASSAGGQVIFAWVADEECSANPQNTVSYYLEGYEASWAHVTSIGVRAVTYKNLPPGQYTFKVKAVNHCGQQKTLEHPLTVLTSSDHVPPQVEFTEVPQDGWTPSTLDFAWEGHDTDDGGAPTASSMLEYLTVQASDTLTALHTGTSVTLPVYPGTTSLLVMATDAQGNMTLAEWAYDISSLYPPVNAVDLSYGNGGQTIKSEPRGVVFVDLNGDGYTDILQSILWNNGSMSSSAYLFDPDEKEWVSTEAWRNLACPILRQDTDGSMIDEGLRFADLNGDGLVDVFRCYDNPTRMTPYTRINTGRGWEVPNTASLFTEFPGQPFATRVKVGTSGGVDMYLNQDRGAWLLDINGDGLVDKVDGWNPQDMTVACSPPMALAKQAFLNRGRSFNPADSLAPYQPTGGGAPATALPGYAFAEHFVTNLEAGQPKALASRDSGIRAVDLNGDGLVDFLRGYSYQQYTTNGNPGCGFFRTEVFMAKAANESSPRLDYLIAVHNPIGGTTRVTYRPSTDSFTRSHPGAEADFCPMVPYVVSAISQDDGRGHAYTTTYAYNHPRFDVQERQFAGFREAVVTAPDGTSAKTTYRQDFPFSGMVEKVESYAALQPGIGVQDLTHRFQESTTQYEASSDDDGVWRVRKTADRTTVWEAGIALRTGVDYGPFDEYDNALIVKTLGNLDGADPSADDKIVATQFISKKDEGNRRWLIGFVAQTDTFDASGAPTSSKKIAYDGGTLTKGHATAESNWLDMESSAGARVSSGNYFTTATVEYNDDGTMMARTDAAEILTTFDQYDPTHRFPVLKTVHGKHGGLYISTVQPDIWGRPLAVTDAKGVTTKSTFDGLGRETDSFVNFGSGDCRTKKVLYHDEVGGQPGQQFVETVTYLPNNSNGLHSFAKYDGLGRTYLTDSPGWHGARIYTETSFDPFGRVLQKSRPHFAAAAVQWITYGYDDRGRVVREEGFGKVSETTFSSPLQVTTQVAGRGDDGVLVSHTKTTQADAYGRLVMVQHDTMPQVFYEYDVMGALVAAHEGSPDGPTLVHLSYDSWGHKLTYQDFDSGAPTTLTEYFYDRAGRLLKQRETVNGDSSKWRETTLVYGGDLGQLTSRTGVDDTGAAPLTETVTYYPSGQGLNTGELAHRADASGDYDFSASLDTSFGASVRSETVAQVAGASVPYAFASYKDWAGRTVRRVLPTGVAAEYAFDPGSGLPTAVTDGAGSAYATYEEYDEAHLTRWTRGNQVQTTYVHNSVTEYLTDVMSVHQPSSATRQKLHYTFQGDGQVAAIADATPAGFSQSFTYDAQLRLTSATSPRYGTLSYSYDDAVTGGGVLLAKGSFATDSEGTITNTANVLAYDSLFRHRVTDTSEGVHLDYDAWGNVAYESRPDGRPVRYTYDAWNRMTRVERYFPPQPGDRIGTWSALARYTYDASGERVRTQRIVSTSPSGVVYHFQNISDSGYEVEELLNSSALRERWAIQGPNGIICWKQRIAEGTAFYQNVGCRGETMLAGLAFDRLQGDLAGATGPARLLSGALSAGGDLLALVRHGWRAFGLDPDGQRKVAQGTLAALGLLVLLILASRRVRSALVRLLRGGLAPALLRRLARQGAFDGTPGEPTPLGPWNLPALRFMARALIVLFLFQGFLFIAPIQAQAQTAPCSEVFYPLGDHLGSLNVLTDSFGNVALTQHFLPFGESLESPRPGVTTCNNSEPWPYGFTGQRHDEETGLIYFHARYYNPATGHFMSPDSVIPNPNDTLSYDRYAYCRNNPVNLTDPTGHNPLIGAIVGAIVGAIMAAINGQNILQGAAMGALAGAMFGGIGAGMAKGFAQGFAYFTAGAIVGGMGATLAGSDNPLQSMLIGGVGAVIGASFGSSKFALGLRHSWQRGTLAVLSGGTIGGLSNVAMGGDFWNGFVQGGLSAGLSFAASCLAREVAWIHQRGHIVAKIMMTLPGGPGAGLSSAEYNGMKKDAITWLNDIRDKLNQYLQKARGGRSAARGLPQSGVESDPVNLDNPGMYVKQGSNVVTFNAAQLGISADLDFLNSDTLEPQARVHFGYREWLYSQLIHEYVDHVLLHRVDRGLSIAGTHVLEGIYGMDQLTGSSFYDSIPKSGLLALPGIPLEAQYSSGIAQWKSDVSTLLQMGY